jgi:hypothetical protein
VKVVAGIDNIVKYHNNVANCDSGADGGIVIGWMHGNVSLGLVCFYREKVCGRRCEYWPCVS